MRKVFVTGLAVLACAGMAQATIVWSDNFDGYADQAAFGSVYTQMFPEYPLLLDQSKGSSGAQSIHFGKPGANNQARVYRNLGGEYDGTDAQPLKLEVMMDLDENHWATRQYIELRSYRDGGYDEGALDDIIAIGATSTGIPTTNTYAGRVLSGPTAGWFSFATNKSLEWTKLTVLIKTDTIEFYVNDVLDTTKSRKTGLTYDSIVIGSGLNSTGADVWFDDLVVEVVPEPATLGLLALGGLAMLRRRRA